MLDKPIDEILYNEEGHVCGIRSGNEKAYAPLVIGDPSYFPEYVHETGKIGRGIAILKGPIEQCAKQCDTYTDKKTGNKVFETSAQIIITGKAANNGRKDDIYVTT